MVQVTPGEIPMGHERKMCHHKDRQPSVISQWSPEGSAGAPARDTGEIGLGQLVQTGLCPERLGQTLPAAPHQMSLRPFHPRFRDSVINPGLC